MKLPNWFLWLALAVHFIAIIAFIGVRAERDDARLDAAVLAGMYNGLLIGRGCELPE